MGDVAANQLPDELALLGCEQQKHELAMLGCELEAVSPLADVLALPGSEQTRHELATLGCELCLIQLAGVLAPKGSEQPR